MIIDHQFRRMFLKCGEMALELGATGAYAPPGGSGQIITQEDFDIYTDRMCVIGAAYACRLTPNQVGFVAEDKLLAALTWIRDLLQGLRERLKRWWDGEESCPALTPFVQLARETLKAVENCSVPLVA